MKTKILKFVTFGKVHVDDFRSISPYAKMQFVPIFIRCNAAHSFIAKLSRRVAI